MLTKKIEKYRAYILFIILFVHFSLMDLFFVTTTKTVFLWEENARLETIATHFIAALLGSACYQVVTKFRSIDAKRGGIINDRTWFFCSIVLIGLIAYIMM